MPNKKRIAIFAHFDKDNLIDDYVIYYLNALKKVCEKIIFVSDCDLASDEQNKLNGIADKILAQKHGEYDFGSYKKGILYAFENENIRDFDECILANDSCYGPFSPFEKIFDKMESENCDFWGITQNKFGFVKKGSSYITCQRPHLQSYFLVFKKEVFLSEFFLNFINKVEKEENRNEVILKYEIGLSEELTKNGFTYRSFINEFLNDFSPFLYKWDKLILNCGMPFLKCSLPRLKHCKIISSDGYEEIISQVSDYPIDLIKKNLQRTILPECFLSKLPIWLKKSIFSSIFYLKSFIRNI